MTLLFTGGSAFAQVTLSWNASTSPAVTGYKLFYGTASGNYAYNVNVGKVTTYAVSGLTAGTTYYFAALAYDSAGDQSGYSNQVSYTVPTTCTYSISPGTASYTSSGGSGSVTVTTQTGCAWTAASAASWMKITAGASGTGSGAVSYTVAANTSTSSQTAASTIAGQSFTVTESGASSSGGGGSGSGGGGHHHRW